MHKLDAEVLTIGDELNRGEIVDTNSSWLAEQLTALGAHVRWRTSVTDDEPDMTAALRQAAGRARLVVCSGGLGPTDDDRTVDVVSRLVGVEPVVDKAHEEKMNARFADRGFRITPNNLRQVRVPGGADVLENRKGLAPGFRVKIDNTSLFFMPGVPRELKSIFTNGVTPLVAELVGGGTRTVRRTWRVAGLGESHVDHALKGLLEGIPDATLHFRILYPECLVTVVIRRPDQAEAQALLQALDTEIRARLVEHVYGTNDETIAEVVGLGLLGKGGTLAVAESCTGGLVGQMISAVPGSSRYFKGGIISYANEVKEHQLGVKAETLKTHGAVSRETVIEMAEGARRLLGTTYAIAVSGVAGPDGGSAEKPVGTVWIAIAGPELMETRHLYWPPVGGGGNDGREQVRMIGAFTALHMLHKVLTH